MWVNVGAEAALLKRRQATTVLPDKDGKLPTLDQRCQDLSKYGRPPCPACVVVCVCVWRLTLRVLRAARAIELAKEPAVRLSGGITGEELAVWEMDLEIAIIQSRIYESIKQNTSGAVPEAERATHVQELGSTLQSLKTLYTKYARDYDLHAESIAILNLRRLPVRTRDAWMGAALPLTPRACRRLLCRATCPGWSSTGKPSSSRS